MTGMSFFISRRKSSTCVSCQLGLGCSATTRSKGSRRSRSANCSEVRTTSALRTNRAFLSSDKQCSTSARKRWTNRMRTRLRLSPITSSDEAGVPSSMSGFSLQRLQKRLEMPGGGGSFPRQTAPPAVMVTSKTGYELHFLTSVQFCTPSTSPVLDKTHSRPVPIWGTDRGHRCFFVTWPCLAAFNTTSYTGTSYRLFEDSSVTTPAQFVPASHLARSARSEEVVAKHKKYLWPSVTNYFQQPLVADRGEMQHLWDVEGNKYLDFFGGILTVSVGHCNPKISTKVSAQVNRLQHTSTLYPNEHIVALAEKIAQITPGNLQQSFFTNSGTEANEAAILLARMSTGSYDVVALRHAYSGGSALAKAVTAHAPYRKGGVISVGISHVVNPYCYRCPLHLKYPDCEVACADDVENLIQTGTSGNIAAFIGEPIQGVGGFITPPKEYYKIVFKIVKKYGGLFIADEVQTGWGRTGKKWFGIEQWEVVPDMITSAKGMANGVPIGLTVTTPEIAGSFQGANIATFGGNPVTSVAA